MYAVALTLKCNRWIAVMIVVFGASHCLVPSNASADIEKRMEKRIEKATATFNRDAEKIVRAVSKRYQILIQAAENGGGFDKRSALLNEYDNFKDHRELPTLIDNLKYRQALTIAIGKCLKQYDSAIAYATGKKELRLAERLADSRDKCFEQFEENFPGALLRRVRWKHANGDFLKKEGNIWHEHLPGRRHAFEEVKRDSDCVYLHDKSRNVSIVLTEKSCIVKGRKGKVRTPYKGEWTD